MTLSPTDKKQRILQILVGVSIFTTFVVVIIGAYTRLVDAGLGCPDWPGCYGQLLVPTGDEEIAEAEALFPSAPVDAAKAWTEMVHRYFATGLGLLILAILVFAILSKQSLKLPIALLILVVVQGAFGAWTVTLKLWPQVVTAHLLGGFATLSILIWYFLTISHRRPPALSPQLRFHLSILLVLIVGQIALGGWTSSNYAALACPDFPTCQGSLWPEMDFAEGFNVFQQIGPDYTGGELSIEGRVAIQNMHRIGAYLVLLVGMALAFRLPSKPRVLLGSILVIQFSLGIANVLFALPLVVAVLHSGVAALLLATVVNLWVFTSKTRKSNHEPAQSSTIRVDPNRFESQMNATRE